MNKVWTNDTDTVVAASIEDVKAIIVELHGSFEDEEGDWRTLPDDKPITIHNIDGAGSIATRTAKEWAEVNGRGFLCSTEW